MNEVKQVVRVASGTVVFENDRDDAKILLVTSTKDSSKWVLPKGGVEPNLTPVQNADKETREEAGVAAQFFEEVGRFECEGKAGWQEEIYYRGVFVSWVDWEEFQIRKREWCEQGEAIARVSSDQKRMIERAIAEHTKASAAA